MGCDTPTHVAIPHSVRRGIAVVQKKSSGAPTKYGRALLPNRSRPYCDNMAVPHATTAWCHATQPLKSYLARKPLCAASVAGSRRDTGTALDPSACKWGSHTCHQIAPAPTHQIPPSTTGRARRARPPTHPRRDTCEPCRAIEIAAGAHHCARASFSVSDQLAKRNMALCGRDGATLRTQGPAHDRSAAQTVCTLLRRGCPHEQASAAQPVRNNPPAWHPSLPCATDTQLDLCGPSSSQGGAPALTGPSTHHGSHAV